MRPADHITGEGPWGPRLPVDEVIPALRAALVSGNNAVLQAPAGAGKTTHVPLALLNEPWLGDARMLMLEPRRLAARSVTHRMAQLLCERVGETVGYRVRHDARVGPRTRIEVVTEGILTRMLQSDPTLSGVGCIIFDEFHERGIHADIGLALALHSQSLVRPDLRIVVMSATLDGARVASLLGDAVVISSAGRTHPIDIAYSTRPDPGALPTAIASKVLDALHTDEGDILVFLPGGGEIRRVASLLEARMPAGVNLELLYGDLSQQAQDSAIAAAPAGFRKVVLSTPIAETSLTIEGVRVVIDSGLARTPRFSPRSGMTSLQTTRISQSSTTQRAGRAGRTAPGKCYRLWPEGEQHHLPEYSTPEILQADLSPLVLELAVADIRDPDELRWLDRPPAAALEQGTQLLTMLGALDRSGSVTPRGRAMAALPVHPRLAHMLIAAQRIGAGAVACDISAILQERDFVRGTNGPADADIAIRLELLHSPDTRAAISGATVDIALVRRVATESAALRRQLGVADVPRPRDTEPAEREGVVLALAYPDRVGRARGDATDGRFLLRNGRGAMLTHPQALSSAEYMVAANLDGDARSARIFLGARLTRTEVEEQFADQIEVDTVVDWDERTRSIYTRTRRRLGAILWAESTASDPAKGPTAAASREARIAVLLRVVRDEGIETLEWSASAMSMRHRIAFMRAHHAGWPDVSGEALLARADGWLAPLLRDRASLRGMGHDLDRALIGMLSWEQRADLDRLAPTHYVAPTGSRVAIDYTDPGAPRVAIRLQEMFGVRDTPTVDGGRIAITLELLSPAHRPVQVTRDLAGFWRSSYFDVRRDLRGRYPKHVWPDDPLAASPTSRAKRRNG
jgi:ATP-dependent RNA helicase HrpB